MSKRNYIKKAISLPPREVWRKARRGVRSRLHRHLGWLRARISGTRVTDAEFLQSLGDHFTNAQMFLGYLTVREEPHFFLDPTHRQVFVDTIRELCPEAESRTIAAADRVCDHVFDLLGSGPTHLGEQIDWHVDFKTGHRFDPDKYYADVRPAPYPGGYDIKVPWELSRCQHFAWLGQAYWFTEDEKYAQKFVDQVLDWIEQNPPQFGVNWACTMDVAIRAVNWLWGYYFFKDSPSLDDDFLLAFFKSLLGHGRHIFCNLENQGDFTSNHYLSNLVSLIYLGILCPEFKEARRWREFGLRELEKEMFEQVYPDGVDFEASTSYHRLVTEMFLSAVILARLNGHEFSQPFMNHLEKMVEFVMYVTKPDGTAPLIGDNDNGRLHRLKVWDPPEREWVDFRYLLAIGTVLFERRGFARAAAGQWEEAVWLFGTQVAKFRQSVGRNLPPLCLESRGFTDAGVYIMRHDDLYLVVNAGPVGQNDNGGHAHNDMFSFEIYQSGETWIGDPGTFVYTADYEARNRFRSSVYHNGVIVDQEEMNRFPKKNPFYMYDSVTPRCLRWDSTTDYDLLVMEHRAYARPPLSVTCRRWFYVDKSLEGVLIGDWILGSGKHQLRIGFQCLSQNCQVDVIDLAFVGQCTETRFVAYPVIAEDGELRVNDGEYSPGYGLRHKAPRFEFIWDGVLPAIWVTYWQPLQTKRIPPRMELDNKASAMLRAIERATKPRLLGLEDWIV